MVAILLLKNDERYMKIRYLSMVNLDMIFLWCFGGGGNDYDVGCSGNVDDASEVMFNVGGCRGIGVCVGGDSGYGCGNGEGHK